jgi:hypothetical protein
MVAMTNRRIAAATVLMLTVVSLPASQATATRMPGRNQQATFKVSVKGVQTTTWSENHQSSGDLCDVTQTGSGSERVVFSSRPVVIKALRIMSAGSIFFVRGRKPATLPGRGHVTRNGTLNRGPIDPRCAVGDGGDGTAAPPPSDCGRKRITSLTLMLGYDPANRRRINVFNDSGQAAPDFEQCPVMGDSWTTILRRDDAHGTPGEELPAVDLFDRSQGKILVLGKGLVRRTAMDVTSTTRIEWTLTLTRLRR